MGQMNNLISLIIPCYNEEESIPVLHEELCRVSRELLDYEFEFLLLTWLFRPHNRCDPETYGEDIRVKYYSFLRNFGKEAAMYAGFVNAKGNYVAVMDADMQDPPTLLPQMLKLLENGEYDSVATRRMDRSGEPKVRSFFAKMFYGIINRISDADIMDGARDFRLMKRDMVNAILAMSEYNRFSKGIFAGLV